MPIDSPRRFLLSLLVMLAVAIGLPLAAALLANEVKQGGAGGAGENRALTAAELKWATPRIAKAVERIRELRFEELPQPKVVSTEALRRRFERDARRSGDLAEIREDELTLKLLGLIEPDADLGNLVGAIAEDVAGAYDPRTGELFIVRDAIPDNRAVADVTLAHELTHALEDQVFELPERSGLSGDRALAESALIEGTATAVMLDYAIERQLLGDLLSVESDLGEEIPPFVEAQLLFAYLRGFEFVEELRRAGRDWDLLDIAHRARPPLSTEQILHPLAYLRYERPSPVSVDVAAELGPAWRRVDSDSIGEFDSIELLELGGDSERAKTAAEGWNGGSYELWVRGPLRPDDCDLPCREKSVLALSWAWDTPRDAREFRAALGPYLEQGLGAVREGTGFWLLDGASAAVATRPSRTTLVFAPTPAIAGRLAN